MVSMTELIWDSVHTGWRTQGPAVLRTQNSLNWFWNTPLDTVLLSAVDNHNKVISDITSGMFGRDRNGVLLLVICLCLWSALAAVNQHLCLLKTNFTAFVTPNAFREKYCENMSFMELEVYVIYVSALHVINLEHGIPPSWMAVM